MHGQIKKSDVDSAFAQRRDLHPGRHVLKLDAYARVTAGNESQRFHKNFVGAARHPHREMTNLPGTRQSRNLGEVLALAQYLIGLIDDPLSGLRQADLTARSIEEPDTQLLLEVLNLLAQRRLAYVE